jgi:hypothetical protein
MKITVRDNRVKYAMDSEDIIHKKLIHHRCSEQVLEEIKMSIFGKFIYYNHDDILISRFG